MNVEFRSGDDRIGGALYLPDAPGPHAGVVVIPDVRGLYEHYHEVARSIASEGFAALALDIYAREGPPELADMAAVNRWIAELPDPRVLGDVQAAIDYLALRPEVAGRKVGLTGFCMGGKYTLLAAVRARGLAAAVAWYGMLRAPALDAANPEHALDALRELRTPLLGLFGKQDPVVPLADVESLSEIGLAMPTEIEVVVYPGAGHAFANDTRPDAYRPDAARDAWERCFRFFRRHLRA
jgi:carboxymethylenebutenolidase